MHEHDFEQRLASELKSLPKEQLPQRDLWAGIEYGLQDEQKNKPRVSYLASAAALAMVSVVAWFNIQPPTSQNQGNELVKLLSVQHQQQKQNLLVSFQAQPALTDNWQEQLKELDEAADAIKKALQQDENNLALLQMLQQVHQQQIDLIERVHAPKWRKI